MHRAAAHERQSSLKALSRKWFDVQAFSFFSPRFLFSCPFSAVVHCWSDSADAARLLFFFQVGWTGAQWRTGKQSRTLRVNRQQSGPHVPPAPNEVNERRKREWTFVEFLFSNPVSVRVNVINLIKFMLYLIRTLKSSIRSVGVSPVIHRLY